MNKLQLEEQIKLLQKQLEEVVKKENEENKIKLQKKYNELTRQRENVEKQLTGIFLEIQKVRKELRDTFNIPCEHLVYMLNTNDTKICRECSESSNIRIIKN